MTFTVAPVSSPAIPVGDNTATEFSRYDWLRSNKRLDPDHKFELQMPS